MKSIYIIGLLLSASLSISAQTSRNADYERYIELYKDIAIEQMQKHRIPASITLAQGLFESGAGKSQLARYSNNHFGIKCHGWTGRKTYHDDDARGECFRVYDNARQSYEDHSRFLVAGSRYRSLFQLKTTDYVGWARGLKKAGYATNPLYADKLIDIIERYELNKYDRAKKYDKYKVQHTSHATKNNDLHVLYTFNSNYYIIARQGDTFRSLGEETGISYKRLAKFNERDANEVLAKGDIIYLKKKQKKAPKEFAGRPHIVKNGESMYLISQQYGIRLESLYKLNRLSPDYQIRVGDVLWVR